MSVPILNKRYDDIPEGAVYIGRPSPWGNPYTHLSSDLPGTVKVATREVAIAGFKEYALRRLVRRPPLRHGSGLLVRASILSRPDHHGDDARMTALKKDGTPRKTPVRKPVVPLWEQQPVPHETPAYDQPPNTDVWWCSGCGARYCFRRVRAGLRGGPKERMVDRRYGFYSCWRALQDPKGKQYHPKGDRVFLIADGAPNPLQPEQPERESV